MCSNTYSITSGGSPELVSDYGAQKAHFEGVECIGTVRAITQMLLSVNQAINQNTSSRQVCDFQRVFN
jgi:hypothetical protein